MRLADDAQKAAFRMLFHELPNTLFRQSAGSRNARHLEQGRRRA